MNPSEQEQWVRIFDIPETKFHKDGYTLYKILSTLFHRSYPEASTSLEVWRRYSSILQLHKEIIKLQNHLQLPESPPAYSKPSMINRFDEDVIEYRKNCTLVLLRHCAKYPSIYASEEFTRFFKDDYGVKKKKLSFGRKEKRSNASLASSLGVPESGLSFYAQLNETTSSNEDLSGTIRVEEIPQNCLPASSESVLANHSNRSVEEASQCIPNSSVLYAPKVKRTLNTVFPSSAQLGATNNYSNAALTNAQDIILPNNSSFNNKKYFPNTPPVKYANYLQRINNGSSSDLNSRFSRQTAERVATPKKVARTRTAEYLERAEQLIARFSLREAKFGRSAKWPRSAPKGSAPQSAWAALKNYRVVGTSDAIIIATDLATQATVAIKVIEKNSAERNRKIILPQSVPFMVPVIRHYETDFAVYLILKYISGGKLWNHLKKFMKQPSSSSSTPVSAYGEKLRRSCCSSSTYEGHRLILSPEDHPAEGNLTQRGPAFEDGDVSEVDQKSFSLNLAVAECKSSIENYSNSCPLDQVRYQSSLSNILALPRHQTTIGRYKDASYVSPYHLNEHSTSQSKSKSLDDLNSSRDDSYKPISLNVATTDVWAPVNDKHTDGDNASIGSDTLSGVSEDFSCSSFKPVPERDFGHPEPKEDVELNTSTASLLSSLPWSRKETSDNIARDVNNLIKNSQKLIEDVNKTLERSKQQIIQTLYSSSKEEKKCDAETTSCKPLDAQKENLETGTTEPGSNNASQHESTPFGASARLHTHLPEPSSRSQQLYHHSLPSNKQSDKLASNSNVSKDSIRGHLERAPHIGAKEGCNLSSSNPNDMLRMPSFLDNWPSSSTETNQQIPEGLVRVWVSQVISAMDHLHKLDIIWGDFNPSNLLLDEGGSILVTFKYSYEARRRLSSTSFAGGRAAGDDWLSSLGYLSPELFNPVSRVTRVSDWWSVGALLFHLLTGKDVASCHPCGITAHTRLHFASPVSEEAASLIGNLLCACPVERLGGSGGAGVQEIKDHPFFFGLEWPQ